MAFSFSGVLWPALFVLVLKFHCGCADFAVLATSTNSSEWNSFCTIYNSAYTQVPVAAAASFQDNIEAHYSDGHVFGCKNGSYGDVTDKAVIVKRGGCTFAKKALVAQSAGAHSLIVVYNESEIWTVPDLQVDEAETLVSIPVFLVSNTTGKNIQDLTLKYLVYVTVYTPRKSVLDPSIVLMFSIAVTTVLLASYIANTPFDFLRYGLLFRKSNKATLEQEQPLETSSKQLSVVSVVVTVLVMVMVICGFLLLLYYFYYPMVYIALGFYMLATTIALYNLLAPFVGLIRLSDRCRVPANKLPILKYRPDVLFFVTLLCSFGIVLWWFLERHSSYAWIIQNILGFAFIAYLMSRLNFLKVWIVALLMILLFFYDIFMVFITPYFTSDHVSVMEKAATGPRGSGNGATSPGETLPVVFTVPRLLYPSKLDAVCPEYFSRPYSLLGYGDVGIPGLLVMLCLNFDRQIYSTNRFRLYYFTSGIAYGVGLVITFIALAFMKTAQPALLYLVPVTLGSVTILSLLKKEFRLFFTGKGYQKMKTSTDRESPVDEKCEDSDTETDHHEKNSLINTEM